MISTSPPLPWIFDLEGTILGFLGKNPFKLKYLTLEVEQETMTVTLPKQLHSHGLKLQPGDRVRCIGCSRLNFTDKTIELEAFQILPADCGSPFC